MTSDGVGTHLPFTSNAIKILKSRYLLSDPEERQFERPEEMFHRVAANIASEESDSTHWTSQFEQIMLSFEFIPGGRTLANAGSATSLVSNCVVLHMDDSIESIFETLKEAALLQQAGSGIGFPFHLLRPTGFRCKRTIGKSTGPMSFLKIFSQAFRVIQQHGRHGANMAVMRIDHPDILEFMEAKSNTGVFENFNFSIGFTDEFMEKVLANDRSPWLCNWKGEKMPPRLISRDGNGRVLDISEVTISAPELMDEIVHRAWSNGEPGCVFIDTVNETNSLPGLGTIECCNPCGEQFLHSGDACNLGSLNLEKFVSVGRIDFERLGLVVRMAVRFLDNVVDLTHFPVDRVNNMFKNNRRIGLGIMGLADMLFLLNLPYNSAEGRDAAASVMKAIQETAIDESVRLGREKGAFPNFHQSLWPKKVSTIRNASLTNVAPTGTTSLLLDVSSGVEPYYALAYRREGCLAGEMDLFVNKHLERVLRDSNCLTDSVMQQILATGTLQGVAEIPDEIKRVYVTSLDISAEDHILMQSRIQEFCCNAISKTINFRHEATEAEIKHGFLEGWRRKCKGLTVYRSGSRKLQVLETNAERDGFMTTCKDSSCDA
jgi:ribonucleoside-diphosphate reductase alpha chain